MIFDKSAIKRYFLLKMCLDILRAETEKSEISHEDYEKETQKERNKRFELGDISDEIQRKIYTHYTALGFKIGINKPLTMQEACAYFQKIDPVWSLSMRALNEKISS